jgi:hypothetical protein
MFRSCWLDLQPNKGGWWKTPHRQANEALSTAGSIDEGDAGIWASCVLGQERRAQHELIALFENVCARFPSTEHLSYVLSQFKNW